jgi:tRNA A37 threonylcarbamoyladenosine dehydratase
MLYFWQIFYEAWYKELQLCEYRYILDSLDLIRYKGHLAQRPKNFSCSMVFSLR